MSSSQPPQIGTDGWQPPPLPPLVASQVFLTRRSWVNGGDKEPCVEFDYSPLPLTEVGGHAQRRISVCLFIPSGRGWVRVSEGDYQQSAFRHLAASRFQGADQLESMLLDALATYFTIIRGKPHEPE